MPRWEKCSWREAIALPGGRSMPAPWRWRRTISDSGGGSASSTPPKLPMPVAADQVVVDHAGGLHECVADSRADELEAALVQRRAHLVGLAGLGGDLFQRLPL